VEFKPIASDYHQFIVYKFLVFLAVLLLLDTQHTMLVTIVTRLHK